MRIEGRFQARLWGRGGPATIDRWEDRSPITGKERGRFHTPLANKRQEEQAQMIEQLREQLKQKPGGRPAPAAVGAAAGTMNKHQRATVPRRAVRRVLEPTRPSCDPE